MSLPSRRLLATALPLLAAFFLVPALPVAAAPPSDTWFLLSASPAGMAGRPVLAMAADPNNPNDLLYGTPGGDIYRSLNSGAAFSKVASGIGSGVLVLAFDPIMPSYVLAGSRGAGIWRSTDSGATWKPLDHGSETVRGFSFSIGLSAAATDSGVFITNDGESWRPSVLQQGSLDAVAAGGGRLLVGADLGSDPAQPSLFGSVDSGQSWETVDGPASSGGIVASMAIDSRRVLLGTNAGLFTSSDHGTTWSALSGGGRLPETDYSEVAFSGGTIYAASDGGASAAGGLWASEDGGKTFRSLQPPVPAVTAIAASGSQLYVATWRPADGSVTLWSYQDGGKAPHAPAIGLAPPPAAAATPPETRPRVNLAWLQSLIFGPEGPYLVLGLGAVLVMALAVVAYLRRGGA